MFVHHLMKLEALIFLFGSGMMILAQWLRLQPLVSPRSGFCAGIQGSPFFGAI
jgi:hypothetical protein